MAIESGWFRYDPNSTMWFFLYRNKTQAIARTKPAVEAAAMMLGYVNCQTGQPLIYKEAQELLRNL